MEKRSLNGPLAQVLLLNWNSEDHQRTEAVWKAVFKHNLFSFHRHIVVHYLNELGHNIGESAARPNVVKLHVDFWQCRVPLFCNPGPVCFVLG